MDTVYKRAADGEIVLHILQPEVCEAPGIVPILSEHIPGRAVGLILHQAQHLVCNSQLILLIAERILPAQGKVFFPWKHGIGRQGFHNVGPVYQLFVPFTAFGIKALEGGKMRLRWEGGADHGSGVEICVQPDNAGVLLWRQLSPQRQNVGNCPGSQRVVRVDADVQLRVNMGIGGIVRCVHAAVFLVNILNFKRRLILHPASHQISRPVGRPVVHHEPNKILAVLRPQRLIRPGQRVRPIIGRCKYGDRCHVCLLPDTDSDKPAPAILRFPQCQSPLNEFLHIDLTVRCVRLPRPFRPKHNKRN